MKKLKYVFLIILILQLTSTKVSAQKANNITPLHIFFQVNFDSTIIYHTGSNWYNYPNYLIVAKHKNQLNFFTYTSPYKSVAGRSIPGNLHQKYNLEERLFQITIPDTNRYFLPKTVNVNILENHWQNLNKNKTWSLEEVKILVVDKKCGVMDDGEEDTFFLITKKNIRIFNFYAADFYAACDNKDINRTRAIKIKSLLRELKKEN